MRSKLPAAERFEEWVVGTVLPFLRKHGGYVVDQEKMTNEQVLAQAVLVAQSVIAEKDAKIAQMEPASQTRGLAQSRALQDSDSESSLFSNLQFPTL